MDNTYIAHKEDENGAIELIEIKELKDTVGLMIDPNYRNRFRGEYFQLKLRYEKLKDFCNKIEDYEKYGMGEPTIHDCPLNILKDQQRQMGELLYTLELRTKMENIEL